MTGQKDLMGAWTLASFEVRRSDGETTYPFGLDAKGLLIYDDLSADRLTLTTPPTPFGEAEVVGVLTSKRVDGSR